MRQIKFKVGNLYNYNYGDHSNLVVLCTGTSCGYGEFALVGIEGSFNAKQTPYAMLTIKALCKGISFLIKTNINSDNEGSYEYEYVNLEDGMLCATEEALFEDKCEF